MGNDPNFRPANKDPFAGTPDLPPYAPPSYGTVRGGSGTVPEVLPPTPEYAPPPTRRRRWPGFSIAPATYILIGINCGVFVAMVLSGVSPLSPEPDQLLHHWGANSAGYVLLHHDWWRILTAMFVHVGFIHLATNMWCLWNLGLLAEPLMGSLGVVATYILTGAAGNLLSTFWNWWTYYPAWLAYTNHGLNEFPAGVGASGAVFGIAGALIVLLRSNRLPVPAQEVKRLRRSVIFFAVINLLIGGGIEIGTTVIGAGIHVDNMAHLGGVGCGLLLAVPMVPRLGAQRSMFQRRLRIAIAMTVTVLVLFGFYLAQLPREQAASTPPGAVQQ